MSSSQAGISLIEVMVVVAIIGILTSIAIPSYSNYVIKAKASELLITANAYKIEVLEHELNSPHTQFERTLPAVSPNIQQIAIASRGQNQQRHYTIDVRSNIATDAGLLSLQLLGRPVNGMISWECKIPEGFEDYMPKACRV